MVFSVAAPNVWSRLSTDLKLERYTAFFKQNLRSFFFFRAEQSNLLCPDL